MFDFYCLECHESVQCIHLILNKFSIELYRTFVRNSENGLLQLHIISLGKSFQQFLNYKQVRLTKIEGAMPPKYKL